MFERILVAIDGGESSRATLETACAMADKYQSKLGILYVTKPEEISDDLIREAQIEGVLSTPDYSGAIDRFAYYETINMRDEMRQAEAVLRLSVEIADSVVSQAEAYTKGKDVKAVKTFVRSGDPAKAILDVASEAAADLIVMGHERRSVLDNLMHRSVTESVDKKAKCPCLVLSQ